MKVVLIQGIDDRKFRIEPEASEIKNLDGLQDLIKDTVSKALDAADMIWKQFPDFKQITLDTTTDEERKLMAMASKNKGGN
jgi:hypothetical protein